MSDRTGELCPFCKKGKLYPSGERSLLEPAREPKSGETRREYTEYECDNCHHRTKAHGISVAATITTIAEVKVSDDTEKTKKKHKE
jgi:hypothetical protein